MSVSSRSGRNEIPSAAGALVSASSFHASHGKSTLLMLSTTASLLGPALSCPPLPIELIFDYAANQIVGQQTSGYGLPKSINMGSLTSSPFSSPRPALSHSVHQEKYRSNKKEIFKPTVNMFFSVTKVLAVAGVLTGTVSCPRLFTLPPPIPFPFSFVPFPFPFHQSSPSVHVVAKVSLTGDVT